MTACTLAFQPPVGVGPEVLPFAYHTHTGQTGLCPGEVLVQCEGCLVQPDDIILTYDQRTGVIIQTPVDGQPSEEKDFQGPHPRQSSASPVASAAADWEDEEEADLEARAASVAAATRTARARAAAAAAGVATRVA